MGLLLNIKQIDKFLNKAYKQIEKSLDKMINNFTLLWNDEKSTVTVKHSLKKYEIDMIKWKVDEYER